MDTQAPKRARIHPFNEARSFWVMGDKITVLGRLDEQDLYVVDVEVPPGSGVPPHVHPSSEVFRVMDGEIHFTVETAAGFSESRVVAGDVLTVPSNAPHGYRNAGSAPARIMCILDGRMVRFFEEASSPTAPPPGPPSDGEIARIMGIAARHNITLLGAP